MPEKIPREICKEALGKYLFTDLTKKTILNSKREKSTPFEAGLFEEMVLNWYTLWKRTSDVRKTFAFLCGCKEHPEYKKFLDPQLNRTIYRGINIKNIKSPFAKTILANMNKKPTFKKTIEGVEWVGYLDNYIPKYEIESWTMNERMAFGFTYPRAAEHPSDAVINQKNHINSVKRNMKNFMEKNAPNSKKYLEWHVENGGIPLLIASSPDRNSVMRPIFSNHIFKEATEGIMKGESETVQLTKQRKLAKWYVPSDIIKAITVLGWN